MSELYPFQEEGRDYLKHRRRAALFDEMRLGKTRQALAAIPEYGAAVVVCPAIAKRVWEDEAREVRPDMIPVVLSGRGSFRWPEPREIVILNYELLPDMATPAPSLCLIADEAHYLKTSTSDRTKRFRKLREAVLANHGMVWLLTGTPLLNKPPDLWNVLEAAKLARVAFGDWWTFRAIFQARDRIVTFKGGRTRKVTDWGKPDPLFIREAMRNVSLRRTRAEVLPQLPEKTRTTLRVDCGAAMNAEATAALAALGADPEEMLDTLIEGFGGLGEIAQARNALAILKIPSAMLLLDEYEAAGKPVVLFSAHVIPVQAAGQRKGWRTILGATDAKRRQEAITDLRAGKIRGVAATIQAAGTAIDLTGASDCVFVDLDWTPANNLQAEDRLVGPRQKNGVGVTVLVADHELDRIMARVLGRKMALVRETLG